MTAPAGSSTPRPGGGGGGGGAESRGGGGAGGGGRGEALEREVRALRRAMFDHAILSMNAVPDRIFDRAAREGWKRLSYESLRAVARVAPLSVPLWGWLAWADAARFRLEEFLFDVGGLSGAF